MIASPYGEHAIAIDLGIDAAPDRARRTHAIARALALRFPGADVVVGAGSIVVVGVDPLEAPSVADLDVSPMVATASDVVRTHTLSVVYDGIDLDEIATRVGALREEIIAWHVEREYVVELAGFLPGFAYLGPLDPRLVIPRRASPRPRVAAGSIGIAGDFTGIYPRVSPGGWNLIGRVPRVVLFDSTRDPPALFAPGDLVRFERAAPSDAATAPDDAHPSAPTEVRGGFIVTAAAAGVTVQDGGRSKQLSRGLPASGPLDRVAYAAANGAVGNSDDAAAIEIPLGRFAIEAREDLVLSIDGESPRNLACGDSFEIEPSTRAVRYLAIAGGVEVPMVLGARATLLAAELGGFCGRTLRPGDGLPVGRDRGASRAAELPLDPSSPALLTIDPGPHAKRLGPHALNALVSEAFRISRFGDRVGVRLEGTRIPREGGDSALPFPMLRGAVQITTDGSPIVLGPDHPTTGGYPVLAIVREASCDVLARVRPGGEVRFRLA